MAGDTRLIIPRLTYIFTNLVNSTSQEIIVAKAVEAVAYREAVLIVRFYAPNNFNSAGQQVSVIVRAEAPAPDDPELDFVSPDLASVGITASTFGGEYLAVVPVNFGSHLRVVVKGTQGAAGQTITFSAILSIALSLKV